MRRLELRKLERNQEKQINIKKEKVDEASRMREFKGTMANTLTDLFLVWFMFQMYFSSYGVLEAVKLRGITLGFLLITEYILYLGGKKSEITTKYTIVMYIILN